jgi:predicted small secreted protein
MTMKRIWLVPAACLALALAFSACQNGVQEIEGDVGINYRALSAPTVSNDVVVSTATTNGLPDFLAISWTAGSGFEKGVDRFEVFIRIEGKPTYHKLVSALAPNPPVNGTTYTAAGGTNYSSDLDKWSGKITIANLFTDMGANASMSALVMADIGLNGIRFGVRAIPGDSYGGYRVPSGIAWTDPPFFPN